MVKVERKGEERPEVLVRRFNREVQQSGVLTVAKKNRYFEKKESRNLRRAGAVRRTAIASIKRGY